MIYIDTSVALAQLLAEDRRPPARLWERDIELLLRAYQVWGETRPRHMLVL